ncbi:hypothetical protein ACFY6U_08240 [Streptomyces sp. NPDC013157]|uniref:hypothetical protein n=1 Tax=Streptomyces sp. NPDC013157 TaxID=3364861 RepID=UPI00369BA93B
MTKSSLPVHRTSSGAARSVPGRTGLKRTRAPPVTEGPVTAFWKAEADTGRLRFFGAPFVAAGRRP